MKIKTFLRRFGFDIVRYRSFWNTPPAQQFATILDIGANTGTFSAPMRERFPRAQIYAFEPLPDCFKQLEYTMAGDKKFTAFNVALGERSGEATIQRSSFHPSSSLLPMSPLHKALYPKSAVHTPERIQIQSLDEVRSTIDLEKPLLIKIDVQGFEGSVIRGGKIAIAEADVLIVETSFVQLYEGQPLFGDILTLVRELGFCYSGRIESHYDERTGQLIYEDSVFTKSPSAV